MRLPPIACAVLAVSLGTLAAEDITTMGGKVYRNVTVTKINRDSLVIAHETGAATLHYVELPPLVREKFGLRPPVPAPVPAAPGMEPARVDHPPVVVKQPVEGAVFGLNFSTRLEDVKAYMRKSQPASKVDSETVEGAKTTLIYAKGRVANMPVEFISFEFFQSLLYQSTVSFAVPRDLAEAEFDKLKAALFEKYGDPDTIGTGLLVWGEPEGKRISIILSDRNGLALFHESGPRVKEAVQRDQNLRAAKDL